MKFLVKLIVETHTRNNIFIAGTNELPITEINDCPKQCCAKLLRDITGYEINPYEPDWLTPQLIDTQYDKDTQTAYIIYVCRIPEKIELKTPYNWVSLPDFRSQLERIRGLF